MAASTTSVPLNSYVFTHEELWDLASAVEFYSTALGGFICDALASFTKESPPFYQVTVSAQSEKTTSVLVGAVVGSGSTWTYSKTDDLERYHVFNSKFGNVFRSLEYQPKLFVFEQAPSVYAKVVELLDWPTASSPSGHTPFASSEKKSQSRVSSLRDWKADVRRLFHRLGEDAAPTVNVFRCALISPDACFLSATALFSDNSVYKSAAVVTSPSLFSLFPDS